MNERIKELAKQARDWAEVSYKNQNDQFTSHWDNPIGYTVSQFFEQKFAELIVKECAEVADNADAIRQKWESIGKYVREHFGVE